MGTRRKDENQAVRRKRAGEASAAPAGAAPGRGRRTLIVAAALLLSSLAAYYPAWQGGMVWDDESHITGASLRSQEGLGKIWLELGSTYQYYPLVHTAFWVQHRLWGESTLGYHLVNIVLHGLSALLLWLILEDLAVPGSVLAAFIFALHPVHVESVAWITELKNTLSGVFFLASARAYLKFDSDRMPRRYALAAGFFCLALLSKSVTAMLPGALLLVIWWRHGRLEWRRDILPSMPFFVTGAASGLFTAWVERTYIGASGTEFSLGILERGLLAGKILWFYLLKLFWPLDLAFVYPRWEVSRADPVWYLYPAGFAALLLLLWLGRKWNRAPVTSLLTYAVLLFPVLGFLNVYPFRFSYVADHFQYLASIPVIVLASAGIVSLAEHRGIRVAEVALVLLVAPVLGVLSWGQSGQYRDSTTLYRETIRRNPAAWMAHANLGGTIRATDPEQAMVHLAEALRLKPDLVEAHYNLAAALQQLGRLKEAVDHYQAAIRLMPGHARAYCNLGNVMDQLGKSEEAERAYSEAIRIMPGLSLAHAGLGRLLGRIGRLEPAIRSCETAVKLDPSFAGAHRDLAGVLVQAGRLQDAVAELQEAVRLKPEDVENHTQLGDLLQQLGKADEAVTHLARAVALDPKSPQARSRLGAVLRTQGKLDEARAACVQAVGLEPSLGLARYELANVLYAQGRRAEAVEQYRAAVKLDGEAAELHCALAMALGDDAKSRPEVHAHMDEALRICPDEAAAHIAMGRALEALGRLPEARGEFEQAMKLAPAESAPRLAIGRIDQRSVARPKTP